ncbi:hypothetical protein ACQ4PT_020819 [Festuca glaucescens]
MPPKRCKHIAEATDAATGEDLLSALPDAILQVVLSFLPSDETVRTCVLSRRWRHLWKSTPALRVTRGGGWRFMEWRAWTVNNFVNQLLLLRDRVPLDECEISISHEFLNEDEDELFRFADTWIRHAVSHCQARVLKVRIRTASYLLPLVNLPFSSRFLTWVELTDVILRSCSLDFSTCPALEDLSMRSCRIYARRIISQSLRRLSITRCHFRSKARTCISTPCLVSFKLKDIDGRAPLLESMLSLVTAFVRLDYSCNDTCRHKAYGDCGDDGCFGQSAGRNRSVLLQGLSGATNLELTCDPQVFIFRKDSKKCPTFTMLKTLLLNDWCVAADLSVLVRLLQHTPVLENLTLQLQPREVYVFLNESYNLAEQLLLLKHLKVVEIKCYKEDEVVHKIVSILSTFGVLPEQIDIEQNFFPAPEKIGEHTLEIWSLKNKNGGVRARDGRVRWCSTCRWWLALGNDDPVASQHSGKHPVFLPHSYFCLCFSSLIYHGVIYISEPWQAIHTGLFLA